MAIVVVGLAVYLIYIPIDIGDKKPIEVLIENGQGVNRIAAVLRERGLIRSQTGFILYARFAGEEKNLKAGRYIFSKSLNAPQIINMLASGLSEADDIEITIPEGHNIWEIDDILREIISGEFVARFYQEEGYLFPDTYRLQNQNVKIKNQNEELSQELKEKMRGNFNNKTEELFKNLSLEQKLRAIIIASILEKEAKTEEDMKMVAGIIENRLKEGMPLEIDATVAYGACLAQFKISKKNCDVTQVNLIEQIKIDSPYNTYIRKGLPIGPISNPGLVAIKATLEPTASDYFYYLSTRDGSRIIYSKTAGEHSVNRKKYLGI